MSTSVTVSPTLPANSPPDSPRVAAEVLNGEGLSISQACKLFPPGRGGKQPSPATLWRWACLGVRRRGDHRVFLEVTRAGCRLITSRSALLRFLGGGETAQPPADQPATQTSTSTADQPRVTPAA